MMDTKAGKTGSECELWRGVVGAAVAAGVSAIVQTGVDRLETVVRKEEIDVGKTFMDLGLNFVTTLAGNYLGGKIVPTNRGWFQTKDFLSVFTKSYGQKILLQTSIGAFLFGTVNFVRKYDRIKFKPVIPVPVVPLYPMF